MSAPPFSAARVVPPRPGTAKAPPRPKRRTFGERIRGLTAQGRHMPCGFESIDRATRGGLRLGDLGCVNGAPGTGKTGVTVDCACRWMENGAHVAFVACDEDANLIAMRFAQRQGFSLDALESADPSTIAECVARADDYERLYLYDSDEDEGCTLEDAAADLAAEAGSEPRVLIVDSLQTARAIGTDVAESPRARLDCVVAACKRIARTGVLVLVTSEMNRGAYRSNDAAQRGNDLASGKESGGIEYGVALLLVLRSVSGSDSLVDVAIPKNRIGRGREPFQLARNPETGSFTDVGAPAMEANPEGEKERKAFAKHDALRERVLAVLRAEPGQPSKRAIARKVGPGRRESVNDAIDSLVDDGTIGEAAGGWRIVKGADPS